MFSTGLSSGAREGRRIMVMLLGTARAAWCATRLDRAAGPHGLPWSRCGRSRPGEAASPRCRRTAGPAPSLCLEPDRSRRTGTRSRSADQRAGAGAFRVLPIAARGHSSGRSAPRPGTRSRRVFSLRCRSDGPSACPGSFFERLDRAPVLSRVTRTATDVREAQRLEELADRALVVGDPEALHDDALQIDPTPAYDPVHSPVRAGLDELPDLCALLRRETGRRAFGPAVQQTLGAVAIEAMDPVAQRLSVHPADPRRLRPVHPVQNRSQR